MQEGYGEVFRFTLSDSFGVLLCRVANVLLKEKLLQGLGYLTVTEWISSKFTRVDVQRTYVDESHNFVQHHGLLTVNGEKNCVELCSSKTSRNDRFQLTQEVLGNPLEFLPARIHQISWIVNSINLISCLEISTVSMGSRVGCHATRQRVKHVVVCRGENADETGRKDPECHGKNGWNWLMNLSPVWFPFYLTFVGVWKQWETNETEKEEEYDEMRVKGWEKRRTKKPVEGLCLWRHQPRRYI